MVGGLVQQQNVRLAEKQLNKSNLRTLSAGKIREGLYFFLTGKTKLFNCHFIFFFILVSVKQFVPFLQFGIFDQRLIVRIALQFPQKLFHPVFDIY